MNITLQKAECLYFSLEAGNTPVVDDRSITKLTHMVLC